MKARIVIGANYGDEGKGTVVAHYTKNAEGSVLNVLTNGGAQRGHSILTEEGSMTFQHFGSGTYYGADNYYSRYFILNPMQFVKEYETLIVKPKHIYRDFQCRWSTPYDSLANLITEQQLERHASCCMGIWNTIERFYWTETGIPFDVFMKRDQIAYLNEVKAYYEKKITIPDSFKDIWNSDIMQQHFINDCKFLAEHTTVVNEFYTELEYFNYDNLIFENGQGLMLTDTGKDTYDTTPSDTGIGYAWDMLGHLKLLGVKADVTAHYVTRPYATRHGDGMMAHQGTRETLSRDVREDRTNHYNNFQGTFRYGLLDIYNLKKRIKNDIGDKQVKMELEVTHCDEMDRIKQFQEEFKVVNTYDSPLIK